MNKTMIFRVTCLCRRSSFPFFLFTWLGWKHQLVQYSSVQSLDRSGRRGTWGTMQKSSLSSLFCRRLVNSSRMGRDVHSLRLFFQHFLCRPRHLQPPYLCALKNGFREAVVAWTCPNHATTNKQIVQLGLEGFLIHQSGVTSHAEGLF